MTEQELLPCAHCGGDAKFITPEGCWNAVTCTKCYTHTGNRNHDYKAINAWNTRVPNPQQAARIKELEAMLEWQDISVLPPIGKEVLVVRSGYSRLNEEIELACYAWCSHSKETGGEGYAWLQDDGRCNTLKLNDVTHWMYKPKLPEAKG